MMSMTIEPIWTMKEVHTASLPKHYMPGQQPTKQARIWSPEVNTPSKQIQNIHMK
jgi:hypothetical protein